MFIVYNKQLTLGIKKNNKNIVELTNTFKSKESENFFVNINTFNNP